MPPLRMALSLDTQRDLIMGIDLQNFFIDTVVPVEVEGESKVQIVRRSVLAPDAESAIKRFLEEDAGVEVERTDGTEMIIIGISDGRNPFG